MVRKIFGFIGFVTLIMSSSAYAYSTVNSALITEIYCGYVEGREMCSVVFNKQIANGDACSTASTNRMQFKVDTDIGRSLLTLGLAAKATKATVYAASRGTCNIYNGISDLAYIEIK